MKAYDVEVVVVKESEEYRIYLIPAKEPVFGLTLRLPVTTEEIKRVTGITFSKEYFGENYYSVNTYKFREEAEEVAEKIRKFFREEKAKAEKREIPTLTRSPNERPLI